MPTLPENTEALDKIIADMVEQLGKQQTQLKLAIEKRDNHEAYLSEQLYSQRQMLSDALDYAQQLEKEVDALQQQLRTQHKNAAK